jgi:hypothetical protein
MTNGLLGDLDTLLAKHVPSGTPPETPAERLASISRLDAVLDAEKQRNFDKDVVDLLTPVLEGKYADELEQVYAEDLEGLAEESLRRDAYAVLFAKCKQMCREAGVSDALPIPIVVIASWLNEAAEQGDSLADCAKAVRYYHRLNGFPDPVEGAIVRAVLRKHGVKLSTPPKRRRGKKVIRNAKANGQAH